MDILLIEDNDNIINGLQYFFTKENYHLVSAPTIKEASNYLQDKIPSLIILDITLPDGNGLYFFEKVIRVKQIPTIFLTALDSEEEIVKCLLNGAEDYMTKPFSTKELMARVKRILLRNAKDIIVVKNIKFDVDKMLVYKDDQEIAVTSLELKILHLLFLNINKVVRRETILDKIWEWTGNDVDAHTVTVYLKRIREKLGTDIIKTIKGIGYRIDEE